MPEPLRVPLDENVPAVVAEWLRGQRPGWTVEDVVEVGLGGATDQVIFQWAQDRGAIIITYDEDFADQRSFAVGSHHGIVRLRVWPTTVEETQNALERLLTAADDEELMGALVIIDRLRIRIRPPR